MNWRPWKQPVPQERDVAMALLSQRVPFNAARLAELADRVAPRVAPRRTDPVRGVSA